MLAARASPYRAVECSLPTRRGRADADRRRRADAEGAARPDGHARGRRDLLVLPAHVVALRSITDEQAAEWFPAPDTHWGLASADALPEYRRRALTLLETLCEVAASGRHRRLYNAISAEVVNGAQDLAMLAALDLASKRKVKRRIGQKTDSPEQIADAAQFLELARTAAQTLKSVCTLYEWRDQYVAAAAACHPPRASRKPDGAPGRTPSWTRW